MWGFCGRDELRFVKVGLEVVMKDSDSKFGFVGLGL